MKNHAMKKVTDFSVVKTGIFIFLFMFIGKGFSQSTTRPGIVPVMKITNLQQHETNPMKIDELKIDVKVVGQIAVTTMEFSYFNTNSRIMGGEFSFPLAEGQTISRFALDINGQMREGVVVEKEQGRKTFEAIVRRGVDPGLLEMTEGNNFRARVYPLPAMGYRKIIIAFEQELIAKDQGYLYQLPLNITEEIRSFSLHAEIIKQLVKLNIEENELTNFNFKKWNNSFIGDFKKEKYSPDKQLAFMIPYTNENAISYTEPIKEGSDSSYFYFSIRPKHVETEKVLPAKITLFWDNSNSCSLRNVEKELLLLDGYFQKTQHVEVKLVPFNITVEKAIIFKIEGGIWTDLRNRLVNMVYDGGTSFGNIDFTAYKCDEILLFSDGLSNFGTSVPAFSKTPVVVINSNNIANHSFLNFITQCSGGQYINLAKLTVNEATEMLSKTDYHFISAKVEEGNASEIYPAIPSPFHNSFSLSGIMRGKTATILLNFGYGNTIMNTERIVVSADVPINKGMLRRVWAQKRLAELSIDEESNKDEITRLGKEYGIVTSNTSLIVLETLNDYLQYKIVPPAEMQSHYFTLQRQDEQTEAEKLKNQIDLVVAMFETRIDWWNKEFKIPEPKKLQYSSPVVVDLIEVEDSESPMFMADMVMEAPAAEENQADEVVVTGYGTQRRSDVTGATASVADPTSNNLSMAKPEVVSSIQLNAWDPQTPYLKVLQYAPKGQEYATYLKLKKEYSELPMFYVDASDFFAKIGQTDTAIRIISNLSELKLEEPQLLRILGLKLQSLDCTSESVEVFKKVLKQKGEDPQSYRDLGHAYEANNQYQLAVYTLYEVIKRSWNGRFPQIELVVLGELNNILAKHKSEIDYSFIDKRLIKELPVDIRVVLTWDTDNCDMDLWVTDPIGEKCFYGHQETQIGAHMSPDYTQGYGPEEFLLKKAMNGEYKVEANYYGTSQQHQLAPVTLHLTFYTNYGKPNQQIQETTIRLENKQDVIDVGKFSFTNAVK